MGVTEWEKWHEQEVWVRWLSQGHFSRLSLRVLHNYSNNCRPCLLFRSSLALELIWYIFGLYLVFNAEKAPAVRSEAASVLSNSKIDNPNSVFTGACSSSMCVFYTIQLFNWWSNSQNLARSDQQIQEIHWCCNHDNRTGTQEQCVNPSLYKINLYVKCQTTKIWAVGHWNEQALG